MQSRKELQMRIDKIILNNIGPYEGLVEFDTITDGQKNIVIVGGKNGAGKTTLFTAMRLCLYGYMSMGYKSQNSYYIKAVKRLINNAAKKDKASNASVVLHLRIHNSRDIDLYEIERRWELSETIQETFRVKRNEKNLNDTEIADFEKYILSLIPPELFNLYFFDGERIADFFLEDGGNTRIKNAFLTLCGYDVFDIMQRNFKRVKNNAKGMQGNIVDQYMALREEVHQLDNQYKGAVNAYELCQVEIENYSSELKVLVNNYEKSGGISQEVYTEKIEALKEEERNRDRWNKLLGRWANDIIPFVIFKAQLKEVKQQISDEKQTEKYEHFLEVLQSEEIKNQMAQTCSSTTANELSNSLSQYIERYSLTNQEKILDLSFEQTINVMSQIEELMEFDNSKVKKAKQLIKKSIQKSAQLREELEHSNIDSVEQYMRRKSELLEEQNQLLRDELILKQNVEEQNKLLQERTGELNKIKAQLKDELKKESIQDISVKAIVMLDELQDVLYRKQIEKVEQNFCRIINKLMRKTQFIDDIKIDNDFNIKIYRNEVYCIDEITKMKQENTKDQLVHLFGTRAWAIIKDLESSNVNTLFNEDIILPVELDQNTLSNGEKQVFIMALYQSLIELSKQEVPFVIDTPFARIDTEHRENISEHFFSKLNGQIFILSTNEEINEKHVQILNEKINRTFVLENTDNKKTIVSVNKYFEESL